MDLSLVRPAQLGETAVIVKTWAVCTGHIFGGKRYSSAAFFHSAKTDRVSFHFPEPLMECGMIS